MATDPAHLALLDHFEALSEHQVSRDICGKQSPPLHDIGEANSLRLLPHPLHCELNLGSHKRLPRLSEI